MRIAVVGGGISGALAARLLASQHDVTLLESSHYVGGHANTVEVLSENQSVPVDTGFMVFNDQTYPNFCRLLRLLDVPSQPTDMSFSVRCDATSLEYQGSSLDGLFAQRRNLMRPRFLKMIADILRFNRLATRAVTRGDVEPNATVGDYLDRWRLGREFRDHYLLPMAAAIWSSCPGRVHDFPAPFFFGFCHNHGLLRILGRPQWRTIVGGSREYLKKLLAPMADRVRTGCAVQSVRRTCDHVVVEHSGTSVEIFDQVVLACHADQALEVVQDLDEDERAVLACFPYQRNHAVLHTDTSQLPQCRRAWASWNYRIAGGDERTACVTYDLTRLQRLPSGERILLTLNPVQPIDRAKVLRQFEYAHPAYGRDSAAAQQRWSAVSGWRRLHFCGAYWGYGFHEDGVNSALAVARNFGIELNACTVGSTVAGSATIGSPR
ncbi:MAG: amine oxidase [Pirellulaceae bacterium]|nr:MAG: amine oxidase [Pirellulaceae bacterium]